MKKVLLVFMMSVFVVVSNAQTIHWLTFIDTEDDKVGNLDKTGRNVLYNRFINIVNAALREVGYKSDIHDIYDSALSPERCKSEVVNLKCENNDIVVFYYIGHGTHAMAENNSYPQMLLGCDFSEENKFIPLKWVHDELKTKGVRLAVTIGMCCNVVQSASAKRAPTFSVNYGNVELTKTEREAIREMFLGYKGDFILSSASVGQSSLGGETPFGDMDLFTAVLISVFEDMAYNGDLNWNSLFAEVKNIVHENTNGKQTPFWNSNLSTTQQPSQQQIQAPTQKQISNTSVQRQTNNPGVGLSNVVNINDVGAFCNYLTSYFDYMLDGRNNNSSRMSAMHKVKSLFSNDAVVKILPQDDVDLVVDKENISVFLGRISSNMKGLILKVIPVTYEHNGQKITELCVKECYKK